MRAALEVYLRAAALSSKEEFVRALPGAFVLVRLDERGGRDEPVPWAWHVLMKEPPEHSDDDDDDDNSNEDVFVAALGGAGVMTSPSDEATATGPAQPPLPLPPARDTATVYVLPPSGGRVGRASGAVVRIDERSISRQHAMVSVERGAVALVDLDSDNGTGVNGIPLLIGTPQNLRSGDVVQLADVVFLFLDAGAFFSHLPALAGG